MNRVKELYELLKSNAPLGQIPYSKKPNKCTITMVSPILNAEGFYRQVVPFFGLNEYHPDIRVLISGMFKLHTDPPKHYNDYDMRLSDALIHQSDWIMFPFVSVDLRPVFKQIKEIQPNCKICYLMDFDWETLPEKHKWKHYYNQKPTKKILLDNMRESDMVLVPNPVLEELFHSRYKDELKGSKTTIAVQPLCYLSDLYADLSAPEKHADDESKFRVVIVGNEDHFEDYNSMKRTFKEVHGSMPDVEFISFGFSGKPLDQKSGFKDAFQHSKNVRIEKPVAIWDYHQKLLDLKPDLAWLIAKPDLPFNSSSRHLYKYMEFASLVIPVFASNITSYKISLTHNRNAILCEKKQDWISELSICKGDIKTRLADITAGGLEFAEKNLDIKSPQNLSRYSQLFMR